MNEDSILQIMSHCPAAGIGKFRILNKELNKRSYEFSFINHHLLNTNSVFGYFMQYHKCKYPSHFVSGLKEVDHVKARISLDFLPSRSSKIEACDTRNGILLCVDDGKYKGREIVPDYIVCKPATKQYEIIPNPKTRYFTIATGLVVIQLKPLRYKIVRVSEPMFCERRKEKVSFYNLNCEVFDSDSFTWKRLDDLELPMYEFFRSKPVLAYGFLHWLTSGENVIRFSMQTETWSIFPIPEDIVEDGRRPTLVSYEGKLGLANYGEGKNDLWVLKNSFEKSWVIVKDLEITGSLGRLLEPIWFPSNDVVSIAGFDGLGLYSMNSNKAQDLYVKTQDFDRCDIFPFHSTYDIVDFKSKDSTVVSYHLKETRKKSGGNKK